MSGETAVLSSTTFREREYTRLVLTGEKVFLKTDCSLRSADIFIELDINATPAEKMRAKVRLKEIVETGQAGLGWRRRLREWGLPF